jgi:deoxyribodipyrimidine photo-lyase
MKPLSDLVAHPASVELYGTPTQTFACRPVGSLPMAPSESRLDLPSPGREVEWVVEHLGHLTLERLSGDDPMRSGRFTLERRSGEYPMRSGRFGGTQAAADQALATLDIAWYAKRRNEVLPVSRRGATGLSPYIRHGLLDLPTVWASVDDAPSADRQKFRDELLWQEYARHVYARLGSRLAVGLRAEPDVTERGPGWDRSMACIDATVAELEGDGWLVNQTRMWLASQWTVRDGRRWQAGEDRFFAHLLDGSRAANRLGWQWTIGAGTGKHYGFSQWQVRKRAPSLCKGCDLRDTCPIAGWPDAPTMGRVTADPLLRHDPDPSATAGPEVVERRGQTRARADAVWLTAESLGDRDPALSAHPELPVVFVFDEPLLERLRLSSKRLVFIADRLAEIATERAIEVHLGDPAVVLAGRALATTFAPVPKWRRLARSLDLAEIYPWRWLQRPGAGPIQSFSAWRRST